MLDTVQPANLRKSLCIHQDEEDSFTIFIVSNGTFLILVKISITYYESWYLVPSFEKTYSKCSSLLSSSEPNSAWQASPWGHSPSSSAPCAVTIRLSRIHKHIKNELCARQRALLGVFSSRFSSVSRPFWGGYA